MTSTAETIGRVRGLPRFLPIYTNWLFYFHTSNDTQHYNIGVGASLDFAGGQAFFELGFDGFAKAAAGMRSEAVQ